MRFPTCLLIVLIGACSVTASELDFDTQIRPILSDHCFQCHGPDENTRYAGLRLDIREGAFSDLGGYAPFVANKPDESEAIRRILSEDSGEVMPPPESNLALSDAEKDLLVRWVADGARWSEHWSFVPPRSPAIPEDSSGWAKNEIDRFTLARMQQAGLETNPEARREALIRRVTLDLTGLPPTPEEIDAFLSDRSEHAYEELVDRLLASPRYGERMAWNWLDAARYADTDGFQGDPTRSMWPWRDWLVRALNDNMPFDRFTIEMLAGDLLPDATAEQVLASAFNRNHMFNGEGGRIAEETRVENVFDRTETTATVWMGLTMTCCRCHDHKYDPISQREYYQLYAFFNNTSETGRSGRGKTKPLLDYLGPDRRAEREQLKRELADVERKLAAPDETLDKRQADWEAKLTAKLGSTSAGIELGNWYQLGPIEKPGRQAFDQTLGPETQVDLSKGVGAADWQEKPELADGKVHELPSTVGATYFYRNLHAPAAAMVQLSLGSDDAIKVFLNGKEVLANFAARAAAADQESLQLDLRAGDNDLLLKIVNTGGIGGFYFRKFGESVLGLSPEIVKALKTPAAKRSAEQTRQLREAYRAKHWPDWKSLADRRRTLRKRIETLDKQTIPVMVMDRLPADRRRVTKVLQRGGYDKPTDTVVKVGTPAVLPPLPNHDDPDRLTLAKWLVDPEHPLTARVTVNRYWQTFFGRGIVKSTEDFGSQGERPTHPKLLDWLAVRFIDSGWDVKAMHKLMVMSATYRQSTQVDQTKLERDPENRFYSRAPRHRLPSWMLRDQALAIGGLIDHQLGGPGVKTYQPEGIWAEATFGKIRYRQDSGEKLFRRSLYVFWRRIVGPTMFFDAAKRQTCEVKPTRTNTPLHALVTLNETTFVEASRGMATRLLAHSDRTVERLRHGFQLATAREPSPDELEILSSRIESLKADFAANVGEATELLSVGETPVPEAVDPAELAAYTLVCSTLLNLDETLCKP
jgi:hypothetical protein